MAEKASLRGRESDPDRLVVLRPGQITILRALARHGRLTERELERVIEGLPPYVSVREVRR